MSDITKLPDGSACFTATILSKAEAMKLPPGERPLNCRLPSEIYHAVWEAIGAASMVWKPRPGNIEFNSEEASKIAVDLCLKIATEIEKLTANPEPNPGEITPAELRAGSWGGPPSPRETRAAATIERLTERIKFAENSTCQLSTFGRGDCQHYVGGPDMTTLDTWGKPKDWCWACWRSYQLEQVAKERDSLRAKVEQLKLQHNPLCDSLDVLISQPCNCTASLGLENAQLRDVVESLRTKLADPPLDVQELVIQKCGLVAQEQVDQLTKERDDLREQLAQEQISNRNNVACADEEIKDLKAKLATCREALTKIMMHSGGSELDATYESRIAELALAATEKGETK